MAFAVREPTTVTEDLSGTPRFDCAKDGISVTRTVSIDGAFRLYTYTVDGADVYTGSNATLGDTLAGQAIGRIKGERIAQSSAPIEPEPTPMTKTSVAQPHHDAANVGAFLVHVPDATGQIVELHGWTQSPRMALPQYIGFVRVSDGAAALARLTMRIRDVADDVVAELAEPHDAFAHLWREHARERAAQRDAELAFYEVELAAQFAPATQPSMPPPPPTTPPRVAIDAPADDERPRPEPIWIRDNAQAKAWAARHQKAA